MPRERAKGSNDAGQFLIVGSLPAFFPAARSGSASAGAILPQSRQPHPGQCADRRCSAPTRWAGKSPRLLPSPPWMSPANAFGYPRARVEKARGGRRCRQRLHGPRPSCRWSAAEFAVDQILACGALNAGAVQGVPRPSSRPGPARPTGRAWGRALVPELPRWRRKRQGNDDALRQYRRAWCPRSEFGTRRRGRWPCPWRLIATDARPGNCRRRSGAIAPCKFRHQIDLQRFTGKRWQLFLLK